MFAAHYLLPFAIRKKFSSSKLHDFAFFLRASVILRHGKHRLKVIAKEKMCGPEKEWMKVADIKKNEAKERKKMLDYVLML